MSKMICMCLGRRCSISGTDHFSRASCTTYVKIGSRETTWGGDTHRKYCVIGEEERVRNNRPRVIPQDIFLIDKDAQELDDS